MEKNEGNDGEMPSELNYSQGLPPTDNPTELTKFIVDPEARIRFEHITKDLATTNLNESEIAYIDINFRLLHMISYVEETLGDLDDIKRVILQDVYTFLQITRSKGGFERLAEITKAMKTYQKYEEQKGKQGWF